MSKQTKPPDAPTNSEIVTRDEFASVLCKCGQPAGEHPFEGDPITARLGDCCWTWKGVVINALRG